MYGSGCGANNLAGKTNAQIAAYFCSLANDSTKQLEAQVLATILAVYATDSDWAGGTYAASYGFTVNTIGVKNDYYNIGDNGAAFGVVNDSAPDGVGHPAADQRKGERRQALVRLHDDDQEHGEARLHRHQHHRRHHPLSEVTGSRRARDGIPSVACPFFISRSGNSAPAATAPAARSPARPIRSVSQTWTSGRR